MEIRNLRPLSLARLTFIWGIIAALCLLMLSVITSFTISQSRIAEEAENLGRAEIARIGLVAERTTSKDRFLLKEIISQSATDPRFEQILVLDPERNVVFSSRIENIGKPVSVISGVEKTILQELEKQGPLLTISDKQSSGMSFAQSFDWPPTAGQIRSTKLGVVLVVINLQIMKEQRWDEIMTEELTISGLFSIILLFLLLGVYFTIKRPLQELTLAAEKFMSGDFSYKIMPLGISEMREVADSFNMMSNEINDKLSELQQSEFKFRSLIECSPVGIVAFDDQGRLAYQNSAFISMTGLPAARLTNITEAEFGTLMKTLCNSDDMQSEADTTPVSIEFHNPDLHVVSCFVIKLNNAQTRSIHYFQDITELSRIDRMKSEFITTAAHELRTPMSTVLGYSELLQTRNLSEAQQKEMVEAIYRQAQSIVYLLEELLDVALIESRADKIFNLRPTDIGTLLTSTASGFMMTGDTRKVVLKPLPELPEVMVDAVKITQALKNCLSNAFKFSSKDSEVTLEARLANPAEVAISITDRGIGMNKEVMERMFEKFYRGDTSGHIPGNGLGMTLVKQIMDYHRGRIEVESTPGNSTTITLFLPVKP